MAPWQAPRKWLLALEAPPNANQKDGREVPTLLSILYFSILNQESSTSLIPQIPALHCFPS